ncbi:MAG TPA: hypothetical protein VNA25_14420 [Phycisphaerae bacterium]|nr:hypothetical protein [Phycisphaerae bacterium]
MSINVLPLVGEAWTLGSGKQDVQGAGEALLRVVCGYWLIVKVEIFGHCRFCQGARLNTC